MASAIPNCPSVSVNFQWAREKNISLLRLSCSCRVASSTPWLPRIRFSVAIIWNSLRHLWRISNSSLLEFTASLSFWTSFSKRSSWASALLLILGGNQRENQITQHYYAHWGKKPAIYPKIHILIISFFNKIRIFKISFFTKFTFSKPHFSQNSHFQSIIFHKIHNFKVSFFSQNSHSNSW